MKVKLTLSRLNRLPAAFTIVVLMVFALSCRQKRDASTQEAPVRKLSIAEIDSGIRQYIQRKSEANNNFFYIQDSEKALQLKLVRVHTEYLSNLGPKKYFACVD